MAMAQSILFALPIVLMAACLAAKPLDYTAQQQHSVQNRCMKTSGFEHEQVVTIPGMANLVTKLSTDIDHRRHVAAGR